MVEFESEFVYLGSLFTPDGSLSAELSRCMAPARAAFAQLHKLWAQHGVGVHIKMLVFKAVIPPTLLYGCESWALSAAETHRLDDLLHDCLRVALGVTRY